MLRQLKTGPGSVLGLILALIGIVGPRLYGVASARPLAIDDDSTDSAHDALVRGFLWVHRLIRPQKGESQWARIPWMTDVSAARRRAVAEDKPILVWRAGGGPVLGRA